MLTVIGTVPEEDFPLVSGEAILHPEGLMVDDWLVPINRGTPALLAAAVETARVLGQAPPRALLVGDIGLGHGSRRLYAHLVEHLGMDPSTTLVFHYLQPDVDWHNKVLLTLQERTDMPVLIADAGYMYVAKMSGQAGEYDLFTPDVGELAFLADEQAPHPFYTRGFILQNEHNVPQYVERAYAHHNAARHLLVKGRHDFLADESGVLGMVKGPSTPALEAMGGTGDTLTGMAATLIEAGLSMERACLGAARANRLAGKLADPTPATQIAEIIPRLPAALEAALHEDLAEDS